MLPAWSRSYCQIPNTICSNVLREEDTRMRRNRIAHRNASAETRTDTQAATSSKIPYSAENALITAEKLRKNSLSQEYAGLVAIMNKFNMATDPSVVNRPMVRAAGTLNKNSSTEIIDIDKLSEKSTSIIQYIEIADTTSRLHCVDGLVSTSCWLKIIPLAKDCHSCNVELMIADKGVILKTVKTIKPGEPLQMWFAEHILSMLNIPFLTLMNIRGKNCYTCHICHAVFEYPNPLKMHIALNCDQLDDSHIWTFLAKKFATFDSWRPNVLLPQKTFALEVTSSRRAEAATGISLTNDSPGSSNQLSPLPFAQSSSNSISARISPLSSRASPTYLTTRLSSSDSSDQVPSAKNLTSLHSAFMPYVHREKISRNRATTYSVRPPTHLFNDDRNAAEMETIVSRMGKSKEGHRCLYCGKLYTRKYGLKIHIRTHTGYKPLKCQFCQRAFGDPSNLNKHVRLHADGDTPYKCDMCGKVLVRRRDLERHMRSRHLQGIENVSETSSDISDV